MPPCTQRCGFDVQPPPWACTRADALLLTMRAGHDALVELCDRLVNRPSGGRLRYEPMIDAVVLTFQRMNGMRSVSPEATQLSALDYNEAAVWVMVKDAALPDAPVQLLIPYMFVDNGVAVAAGRELYGFPKEFAQIVLPGPACHGEIVGLAAMNPSSSNPAIPNAALITAYWKSLVPLKIASHHSDRSPQAAMPAFDDLGFVLGATYKYLRLIELGNLNFVLLRQIRAVSGGSATDLQQVIAATAAVPKPGVATYLGTYGVCFGKFGSHPFATDLGLSLSTTDNGLDAIGVKMSFGFELGVGVVL